MKKFNMKSLQELVMNSGDSAALHFSGLNAPFKSTHSFFEPVAQKASISNVTNLKPSVAISNNTVSLAVQK